MKRKDWLKNKKKKKIYSIFDWKITDSLDGYLYKSNIGKNFKCTFRVDERGTIYNILLKSNNNITICQFNPWTLIAPTGLSMFGILDCEKMIGDFLKVLMKSLRMVGDFNWGNYEKASSRASSLYCLIGKDIYIEKNLNDYYLFLGKTSIINL